MPRTVQAAVLVPLLTLAATGCATKGWVKETLSLERATTAEQVQQVERRLADEAGRVDALNVTVKNVGEAVHGVDGTARAAAESARSAGAAAETARGEAQAARERAETAVGKAGEVDERVTTLWSTRHNRTVVDTMDVHFPFNRWELTDGAQTALLSLVEELKKNPGLGIVLQGYTDGRGDRQYNLELSRRRVDAVRRFLVERGVELWRVDGIGLGPVTAADVPDRQKRRVSVLVTHAE